MSDEALPSTVAAQPDVAGVAAASPGHETGAGAAEREVGRVRDAALEGEKDVALPEDGPSEDSAEMSGEDEPEGDDVNDDEEDEEDVDPALNQFEADGFLVAGDEDDEDAADKQRKTGRRNEERFIPLEQDDLELIEGGTKRLKRLRRKGDPEEVVADPRAENEGNGGGRAAAAQPKRGKHGQQKRRKGRSAAAAAVQASKADDADDFDVPDEPRDMEVDGDALEGEEEDDDGFIVGAKRGRGRVTQTSTRVTDQQLKEWKEIFGDEEGFESVAQGYADGDYNPDADEERVRDEDDEEAPVGVARASQDAAAVAAKQEPARKLEELFDPMLLASTFRTPRDRAVQSEDMPERFQLRMPHRVPPTTQELQNEAQWILKHVFVERDRMVLNESEQLDYTKKVFNVLYFMRTTLLEIPFIVRYRPDYVTPLSEEQCWDVYEWDSKWHRLATRRQQLLECFGDVDKMLQLGADDRYLNRIELADTEEDLKDLSDYFQFYFADLAEQHRKDAQQQQQQQQQQQHVEQRRQPTVRDPFREAVHQGLVEPAKRMAISAAQFGENMWNNQLVHVPADEDQGPEDFARQFLSPLYRTPEEVLAACRTLLARQLAVDPNVRQAIRVMYVEQAVLNTDPTEAGIEEIDFWHPWRNVKRLAGMPVKDCKGSDTFALVIQAEKAGLITVSIDVEDPLEEMLELYLSKSTVASAQAWNKQRRDVLLEALARFLHPQMKREVREQLETWTHEHIADAAAATLERVILSKPLNEHVRATFYEDDVEDRRRVPKGKSILSICVPDDTAESPFGVVVNKLGDVLGFEKLSFFEAARGIAVNQNSRRADLQREDRNKVGELIKRHRPGVIVVCALPGAMNARSAYELLRDDLLPAMAPMLANSAPRVVPMLHWLDARAAQVFRATATARAEFPDYPAPLLLAISGARAAADPLLEYARLWDDKSSIAFVPFHQHQKLVPRRLLLDRLERAFVRATSHVGVNINHAWQLPHLGAALQFVPGLGPRKAQKLLKDIRASGRPVDRRTTTLRALLVGGNGGDADSDHDVVYTNAVAYLRIDKDGPYEHSALDRTRIHPDDYRFAQKICADAMEVNLEALPPLSDSEMTKNAPVADAMKRKNRDELVRVDVAGLADFWLQSQNEDKRIVFAAIRSELMDAFKDERREAEPLTGPQVFEIVTGESEATLPLGKLVQGVVTALRKGVAAITLQEGLRAFVHKMDISDDPNVMRIEDKVEVGMPIAGRVKAIDFDRWEVQLTCKGSELKDDHWERFDVLEREERYLRWKEAEEDRLRLIKEKRDKVEAEQLRQQRVRGRTAMRVIDHPSFHNYTLEDVTRELADAPPGEALFRPSTTKGSDFLTLSFKGLGDTIVNVAVAELDKPNEVSLGRRLKIKGAHEDYEDLDEIIARYVNPVAGLMRALAEHRHFMAASSEEIEAAVMAEKKKAPEMIPYKVGAMSDQPGWFKLYYVPNRTVHHEIITLRPAGYRMRSRTFATLKELFDWFKRHWSDKDSKRRR